VLTFQEIRDIIDRNHDPDQEGHIDLDWDPGYDFQAWCDGVAPLIPTGFMKVRDNTFYVGYTCSSSDCWRCKYPNEHHKLIREDGMDSSGRRKENSTKKKKPSSL